MMEVFSKLLLTLTLISFILIKDLFGILNILTKMVFIEEVWHEEDSGKQIENHTEINSNIIVSLQTYFHETIDML